MALRQNLAPNPSFEDGAVAPTPPAAWTVLSGSGDGFFWEDTSSKHRTVTNPALASVRLNNDTSAANGLYSTISLAAGTYTVSVWAQVLSGTTNAALIVRTHSSGTLNGQLWGSEQHWTSPNGTWTRKSTTFTLGATTSIDVILGLGIGNGGPSAGSVRFDEVLVEAGSALNDYFDGGYVDTDQVNYSWAGTPNNSISIADDGSVTPPDPPQSEGWSLVETNSAADTFAVDGPLDSNRFYTKDGFDGTNGDGTYYADRTYVSGGQVIVMPDQDRIGGFDSQYRPLTYGKWDVYAKVRTIKGYKGVIFLWPDSEQWNDGEWDFVECTDDTGATFEIYFHKPGDPEDNSKNTRVSQNITGSFNKFTIEKLATGVTVKVNDIQVYQVTNKAWVGTTPCHLVVQSDVGVPDGANGIDMRDNYPANTNPRFQIAISRIDIWEPSDVPSSAPLSASDRGSSSDSAFLGRSQATLYSNADVGRSADQSQLLVPLSLNSGTADVGRSADTASLSTSGSTPSTLLSALDAGSSSDSATLGGSRQYLTGLDVGQSSDQAALTTFVDLSVRPVVGSVAERIYGRLEVFAVHDAEFGWPLLRYVAALSDGLQWTDDLVRDSDTNVGWSSIMDLDTIPDDGLAWLAQFVGVNTIDELDPASQRLRIHETAGFQRGTVSALAGAARQYLVGSRSVVITERDTSPYHLNVTTFAAETPDSTLR